MVRTIKVKLYKYDELSEEAKQKVLEHFADINTDYEWYRDDGLLELSTKELKSRHIKSSEYQGMMTKWDKLYFDIDRGQYVQFPDLQILDDNVFRKFLRIDKRLWNKISYSFQEKGRYANTELVIENNDYADFTNREQSIIDRAIEIFADKIHEAWKMLRNQYEYNTSREGIEETIRINEYEFTENGELN